MVYKLAKAERDGEYDHEGKKEHQHIDLPSEIWGLDREALEDWASEDFEMGARYGNEVARGMARAMNPYARLCGAVVGEVLRREMGC